VNIAYSTSPETDPVGLGEPPARIPSHMHAWTIRPERFGEPAQALRREVVPVPDIGDDEVLVYVMAAGINYNGIWAGLGRPVDVVAMRRRNGEPEDFHIAGSDGAGIVCRVGRAVTGVRVGDEVVLHGGHWDARDPDVLAGGDPVLSPTFRAWGYETNYGSFAQYARVQEHQCVPKPAGLSWTETACFMVGGGTAYRMLHGCAGHEMRAGDVVLIWGGAGGLGALAIQLAALAGARPVAVVSSADRAEYCRKLGAVGCVDRTAFDHWGRLPDCDDADAYETWLAGVRAFGKAVWQAVGERVNPRIVFEHPGEDTLSTSLYVCARGGMVVTCGATTGYAGSLDLRYLWMHQKRLQGSHICDDGEARRLGELMGTGAVDPCLSRTFAFDELPLAHQLMFENRHSPGNMAVTVGAATPRS
jgi:crotonyl-CoA carboxylase/reductase